MNDGTLRMLKVAAIVMAVMIVLGTTTLFVMMAKKGMSGPAASPVAAAPVAAVLDEPPGTRIVAITSVADRLAVQLAGGGADRVVLLDARTGQVAGRVALAR